MDILADAIQDLTAARSVEGEAITQQIRSRVAMSSVIRGIEKTTLAQLLHAFVVQIFVISLLIATASLAQAAELYHRDPEGASQWLQTASLVEEEKRPVLFADHQKVKSSWAFAFDNDLLAPGHRDQDYTYGMNLTYSGADASDAAISLRAPLAVIDQWLGVARMAERSQNNDSVEAGLFGFTPEDITQPQINSTDRPYASLVYLSSSHEQVDKENDVAWKTTLSIGALGLGMVGSLQNSTHEQIAGKRALGWNHQISDGGELTARYAIARQQYLGRFADTVEVKSTLQASLGYLTETSWSLSFRNGKITSPWASFNPDLISYGEKSTYTNSFLSSNEHYLWAGVTLKARFYNAFLQGQFRESDLAYSYDSLRPIVAEGWVGYTFAFKEAYRISYVLRAQTSEIERGSGDRSVVWGGLIFARTI